MEWMQVLTNLLSIGAPMAGAVYIFYSITSSRIDKMDAALIRMDKKMHEALIRMDEKFIQVDAKWEGLFEKLSLKEQGKV